MMKNKNKGMALVWSLLLMSILVIISTMIATLIIKDSRLTIDIQASTRAYAAARTGIDWGVIYNKANNNVSRNNDFTGTNQISGFNVNVVITDPDPLNPTWAKIESTASDQTVKRKIVYYIKPVSYTTIPTLATNNKIQENTTISHNGSFSLRFHFWDDNTGTVNYTQFGVRRASIMGQPEQRLGVLIENFGPSSKSIRLFYNDGATSYLSSTQTITSNKSYQYFGEIIYIDKTSATLRLLEKNPVSGNLICLRNISLNLSDKPAPLNFTNLLVRTELGSLPTSHYTNFTSTYFKTDTDGAVRVSSSAISLDNVSANGLTIGP